MNESIEPASGPPRLSLSIVALWLSLLVISICLWIALLDGFTGNLTLKLGWFGIRFYSTKALLLGTGVTIAALIGHRRIRGDAWTFQPGHILLLAIGFCELGSALSVSTDHLILGQDNGQGLLRSEMYDLAATVQHGGLVLILIASLCLIPLTRFWQFVFGMIVFFNLLILLMINPFEFSISQFLSYDVLSVSSRITRFIIPALIATVGCWDLLWRERRDWLHWVGVVVSLLHYTAWMNPLSWF